MATVREYPIGIDCCWISADREGRVAALITAGEGEIPGEVLNNDLCEVADIESLAMQLPEVASATVLVTVPRPDSYIDLAERGLYVYDWAGGVYELVARPSVGVQLHELAEPLRSIASMAPLSYLSFSDTAVIDVPEGGAGEDPLPR
jgi:hypothetical protein